MTRLRTLLMALALSTVAMALTAAPAMAENSWPAPPMGGPAGGAGSGTGGAAGQG